MEVIEIPKRLAWFFIGFATLLMLFGFGAYAETQDELVVYFLDVGQGDAALVQCGGQSLLIDGGDRNANQFIYSFLQNTLQIDYLDYVIATHPHDDHTKGLAAALSACNVGVAYAPVSSYDSDGFNDFLKKLGEQDKEITIPQRGDTFSLGAATVTFLSNPNLDWDVNDWSLVVKITLGVNYYPENGHGFWLGNS